MVKHVKLFENWAEENLELPEYLDPNRHMIGNTYTLFHSDVKNVIASGVLDLGGWKNDKLRANFKSFSDYDFWRKNYDEIEIEQTECVYRLENCYEIPETPKLKSADTYIKSLKGLENREFTNFFKLMYSKLENLKYCPTSKLFRFNYSPLLSYYGITSNNILNFTSNICGELTYEKAGYRDARIPTLEQLNDPKFNGDIFCHFPNVATDSKHFFYAQQLFNSWNQIYDDPNEVENYEFLFVPFYENPEKFRDKVKEYLPNVNLSGVTIGRTEVW